MTVLWVVLGCWLALLALLVALRARATSNRTPQLRRPMRSAQLRALRLHTGAARVQPGARRVTGARRATPSLAAFDPRR